MESFDAAASPPTRSNAGAQPLRLFVDAPRCVERVVDVPYEVRVERPIEHLVENVFYLDRRVEVPVRRVVELPFERVTERRTFTPVERAVDVPRVVDRLVERVVEVPVEVVREVLVPVERRVVRDVEQLVLRPHRLELETERVVVDRAVRVESVVDRFVDCAAPPSPRAPAAVVATASVRLAADGSLHSELRSEERRAAAAAPAHERLVDVRQPALEREERVAVLRERLVALPLDRVAERVVELERAVQVPVVTLRTVDVPVERVVERVVERPVARVVEVPRLVEEERVVEVLTRVSRPVAVELPQTLRCRTTSFAVSRAQRDAFLALGDALATLTAEAAVLDRQGLAAQRRGLRGEALLRRNAEMRAEAEALERGAAPPAEAFTAEEVEYLARRLDEVRERNARLERTLGRGPPAAPPARASLPLLEYTTPTSFCLRQSSLATASTRASSLADPPAALPRATESLLSR